MLPTAPREQLAEALKAAEREYREAQRAVEARLEGAAERYATAQTRLKALELAATLVTAGTPEPKA